MTGLATSRVFVSSANETYSYDGAGNLVSTTYSGDTHGRLATMTGTTGVSPVGDGDTGTTGVSPVGGGNTGRTGVSPVPSNTFAYSYLPGTDLVSGYTCGGFSRTVAYEPYRDLVSAITNRFGSRVISTFEYTNDAAGRRTAINRSGEAMGPLSGATDAYGYNGRNEVVSSRRTLGGESVAGFNEDFAYDPIGNRISSTDYDETGAARTSTYAANNLNQYTARTVPGWASVRGLADADATVAVNGNPAFMTTGGPRTVAANEETAYFFGSDDFDNSTGGGLAELEVSAVVSDGTNDLVSVVTNKVFVPPANETYAYDADGNMMEDARFRYYWNGENRMIRAEEKSAPQDCQPYVVTYAYDHMGRNVVKDGVVYVWDDYNIIVEDAASSNATFNTWGLDLDGTMQGVGGVGGLLAVEKGGAVYVPAYDANGNVTEYIDGAGAIAAHYAYSAFGRQLLAEDDIGFTYRFSTKPYGPKTLLVEYEFRKYAPNVGRWASRDPLNEDIETEFGSIEVEVGVVGSANQYCGLGNNPVRLFDADGLFAQFAPAVIRIGTELGKIAVAGVAAALATAAATEAAKKCPQPRCNPCDPPVGTKGYRFEQVPPGKPHRPISGSHVHFYEVHQSPVDRGCGCFWHDLNETVASDSPPKGMVNIKNNPVRGGGIRYD